MVALRTSAVRQIGQKSRHWNSIPLRSPAARKASNGLSFSKWKVSSIGGVVLREPDDQHIFLESRLAGAERHERRRQQDVALVTADPHDQLEPDLLQLDLGLLHERDPQAKLRAIVEHHKLLAEVTVEHVLWLPAVEHLRAQPLQHRRPDHLLLEERRA